jgi:predicted nucleic acid-binding protein
VAELTLLDSDVLIAHLRGYEPARAWLRLARIGGPLEISVLTITEITGGMRSAERNLVWDLLAILNPQPVSEAVARRAGELWRTYRRSHQGIGVVDYVIAATAEVRGAKLAILNVKHYPMFEGLQPAFAV